MKSGYNDTSKSKSWNVLETVLSHLKTKNLLNMYFCFLSVLQGVLELAKEQGKLLVIDAVEYLPFHTTGINYL